LYRFNNQKQNNMNATFSISKIITVITGSEVYTVSFSDFANEIAKFNEITVKGYFSAAKYYKYVAVILNAGFELSKTNFIDYKNDCKDVDFRLTYTK